MVFNKDSDDFSQMLEHFWEVIVDFASVADKKNDYLVSILVYLIDDSVVAYS